MIIDLKALAKSHFDLDLSDSVIAAFDRYADLIIEWNQRINLTAIVEPNDIRVKHFLDSISLLGLPDMPDTAKVVDVGTGAGLPGIPLAILRPNWQVVLMDATGKKVTFLRTVIQELGLKNVVAAQFRAEDAGRDAHHREQYDWVVARAVARLPVLLEYLLPLCKLGGTCIAMKGDTAQTEAEDSTNALAKLGGKLQAIYPTQLLEQMHYLVVVKKSQKTPADYPRRAGMPSKNPL